MSDFQSFRNAVLEDDDLQDEVMSVVMTATRNGSGLGDGIATLGMNCRHTLCLCSYRRTLAWTENCRPQEEFCVSL